MSTAINNDPTYDEWLRFIFDRPELAYGESISLDGDMFDASPQALVHLIGHTCMRAGKDLLAFSDAQVCAGLDLIFNPSLSNFSFALKDESVSIEKRLHAIQRIEDLYVQCFSVRCSEKLSNGASEHVGGLNPICYMLWDVSPLSYWENSKDAVFYYQAVVNLLSKCLHVKHIACVESALHGLGHLQPYATEAVQNAIDSWTVKKTPEFSVLQTYAALARQGRVQ